MSQRAGSAVDVCCRNPNYKSVDFVSLHHSLLFCTNVHLLKHFYLFFVDARDPWPEQEQAREESRALGEGDQWRLAKTFFFLLMYFPNSVSIRYVHFENCLNFQMEQRCEERSQRCSGKVQSCLQFATTKSCRKPGTSKFCN